MDKKEKEHTIILMDLKRILCASSLSVIVLVCMMFFSSIASQFHDSGVIRGSENTWQIDLLVEQGNYSSALSLVDSLISEKRIGLPRFAYFDRYLSEEKRYDASVARKEIYDLQWKRIRILQAKRDETALKDALEDYADIIGYNQERAKVLLNLIKEKQQ